MTCHGQILQTSMLIFPACSYSRPWIPMTKCISREICIRFLLYHEFSFNPHKQGVMIISSILPIMFINYIMRKSSEIHHLHSKIIQKSSSNFYMFSIKHGAHGASTTADHGAPGFTSQLRHLHARGSELGLSSDFTRGWFHQENWWYTYNNYG